MLQSDIASQVALIRESWPDGNHRVLLSTVHATKGLEVRALHILVAEDLRVFDRHRHVAYMAVTRAKTSLSIYHSGDLPGPLDAALRVDEPRPVPPTVDDAFGRR
jgi:superfamily I DNA/RNA helicase